ncbi:MAG: 2,3-butanediol dehydrogenase [Anaerolineae bacterium]|nr:2,3-butanediol dehydrogenase [Anaerolineae bacterium]
MKAAVWHGQRDVRIEDIPEPAAPGEGEVKLQVGWCGICGTDLHEYAAGPIFTQVNQPHPLSGRLAPLTPGHEFAGTIVEVGSGVSGFKVGDRVAPNPLLRCGTCAYCRQGLPHLCTQIGFMGCHSDGGFGEYVNVNVVRGSNPIPVLYKLPDKVSLEAGAMIEPLAVGVHATKRGHLQDGETVVVVGAGPIGICTIQAARAAGASQIIVLETAAGRRNFAEAAGATAVIDPTSTDAAKAVQDLTNGMGVDCAFECVGAEPTLKAAISTLRKDGRAVVVGIFEHPAALDYFDVVFFEKTIIGTFAYRDEFDLVIDMLADGRLQPEPMVTGKIGLNDLVAGGFEELLTNKEGNVKILVAPE